MAISWGYKERFKFDSCGALSKWQPPVMPAVYAITYKQDPVAKPKAHTVLYFGEAENLAQESVLLNSKILELWKEDKLTTNDLFVFVHPMNGSSRFERARVQERLVAEYQPQINDM